MIEYRVYLVALPTDVRGAVRISPDGFASIYINAALSYTEQQKVFRHEMRHLRRGDMYSFRSIRQVERRCKRENKIPR